MVSSLSDIARSACRKRARWLVGVTGLAISMSVVTAPSSVSAADGPFVIGDDTVPDDAAMPQLEDPEANVKELGPLNSSTTKIGVIHSDAVPTLGLTNPNASVDLRQAWLDTARDPVSGDDWLYFAWERDSNNGSGFIAYEFMQDPPPAACDYDAANQEALIAGCNPWANRQAGDFMILWDQQGGSTDLYLLEWSGTAPNLTLSALSRSTMTCPRRRTPRAGPRVRPRST